MSSSNFPRFDRNLNTGGNNYDESKGVVAHNVGPPLEAVPVADHGHRREAVDAVNRRWSIERSAAAIPSAISSVTWIAATTFPTTAFSGGTPYTAV